jgi:ADP-ribosylglycohydrolase
MRSVATLLLFVKGAVAQAKSKEDRIRGAYFGALVSDALCLGSHYEYDAKVIKQAYGGKPLETYMAPGEQMGGSTHGVGWGRRNYHPGQKKGDNTDYGLYNELVLEYLSARKNPTSEEVDLEDFVPNFWMPRIGGESWGAWRCTQSKQAFQAVQGGRKDFDNIGGHSNAMSLRSAPIFAVARSEDAAAKASQKTMFTHRNTEALLGGEFFTRAAYKIIHENLTPREAFEKVRDQMKNRFVTEQVRKGIAKYEEAVDATRPLGKEEFVDDLAMTSMARLWDVGKTEPIKVGKASPTEGTMPSSIYIVLKYLDDPIEAFKANAMVGGDNAARSVAIGMTLGAYHGASAIPKDFQKGLNAWPRGETMLSKFGLDAATLAKKVGEL